MILSVSDPFRTRRVMIGSPDPAAAHDDDDDDDDGRGGERRGKRKD